MPTSSAACAASDSARPGSRFALACATLAVIAGASTGSAPSAAPSAALAPYVPGVVAADSSALARSGFLPGTPLPDRDAAAIAALRARGPAGLAAILREYDAARPAARPALGATVDAVAAQRYATVSRLYWHTELEAAVAEAASTGKPILALRMLGRLDEDLSCANSRFFRTALYSNQRVAELLRQRFVLLWTTERPVPRVTIDFGDGRTMLGTVTGNSIHYVLDAEGRVLDALPGLYAPKVFVDELTAASALAAELRTLDPQQARDRLARHFERERQDVWAAFQRAGDAVLIPDARRLLGDGEAQSTLARAQRATMGKGLVEVPLVRQIAAGADPGTIDAQDVASWASIGQAMFGIGQVHGPADGGRPMPERGGGAPPPVPVLPAVLDARARQLVLEVALAPAPPARATAAASTMEAVRDPAALIARFEQLMVADTAINQLRLRPRILAQLGGMPQLSLEDLNRWVYDEVFATPGNDPWLGMRTLDGFTGLPGDGAVTR